MPTTLVTNPRVIGEGTGLQNRHESCTETFGLAGPLDHRRISGKLLNYFQSVRPERKYDVDAFTGDALMIGVGDTSTTDMSIHSPNIHLVIDIRRTTASVIFS